MVTHDRTDSKGILCLNSFCMDKIGKKMPQRSLALHNVSDAVEDTLQIPNHILQGIPVSGNL